MSKTKSKREYVVGYKGDNQCVYGPDGIVTTSCTRWVDRMTTETAKRRAGRLLSPDVDVCIYRLVPVATGRAGERRVRGAEEGEEEDRGRSPTFRGW